MNLFIRLLALCLGLSTGWALAAPKKDTAKTPAPKITKKPETCKEQCDLISESCMAPCEKATKPQAKTMCRNNCDQMIMACDGSCRDKGHIDSQYMKEHIKAPKAPPGVKVKDE
jgi:hypothetical protein